MPELADVEFYRAQWDCARKEIIRRVSLHADKRIFRGANTAQLRRRLLQAHLIASHSHGKQMLFKFSNDAWLGIHLGMTGELLVKEAGFSPGPHDHLALFLARRTLVFRDPRQFGRIRFDVGASEPDWWRRLPPDLFSRKFTRALVEKVLQRRARAPLKAVLLMQEFFPGIGNWMADEILWRAKIHPRTPAGSLRPADTRRLWDAVRFVSQQAMKIIGKDSGELPRSWLFHYRWRKNGICPRCRGPLRHATIGGRTTCWCQKCQGK